MSIKNKLSNTSYIIFKGNYFRRPNTEQYLFTNKVLINNRNTIQNIPDLSLQSYKNLSIIYTNSDLYNQFHLNTGIHYQLNNGQYFSKYTLTPFITQIEYFFLPQNNSNISADINLSKFISFLSSTFKYTSSFTSSQYSNIINDSNIRTNLNNSLLNDISLKTAFNIPFNFETKLQYQKLVSKSKQYQVFSNNSILYTFKTIYNPNSLFNIVLNADYYLPNSENPSNKYLFIDAMLRYKPKEKLWELGLNCKNLANEHFYSQIQTTDFSTSISRSNILSRYLLLNISYRF